MVGDDTPAKQNDPGGQAVALAAPAGQKNCAGHGYETPLLQKYPEAQVTGAETDGKQYDPCGHAVGVGAPDGQKNCAGHALETPF